MKNPPNISGINYDRITELHHRKSMITRLVSIFLILLAMAIVAFLLFNPIKPRPTAADYIARYNKAAEVQGIPDRLNAVPADLTTGSTQYRLPAAGLILRLAYDSSGYVTGIDLSDDAGQSPENRWQSLSSKALRNQLFLTLYSADPKQTIAELYRTFDEIGIDLDQPLDRQPAGTRTANADGLKLTLVHDPSHFTLSIQLDLIDE